MGRLVACLSFVLAIMALSSRVAAAAPKVPARRAAPAAQDAQFPFSPQSMWDDLFGKPTEEEEAEQAKVEISTDEEREFGKAVLDQYFAKLNSERQKIIERGRDVEYLRKLVAEIRPLMKNADRYREIKIYIVDSPLTDARSIPGGTLVFYRGLLDFAESEAALVGVIGHELSHLDRGHQLNGVRRMKRFEQALAPQDGVARPDRMMFAMRGMVEGFARPFRPEAEAEADRDGADWAFQAGYDPREFAELFLKLHRRDGEKQVIPFLQTHPFRLDRHRAIQQQFLELKKESPDAPLYIGRENLKKRIPRSQREFE